MQAESLSPYPERNSMRKANDQTLKEVISELVKEYHLSDKLKELKVLETWPAEVGKLICHHTVNISFREGKLFVTLDNAAMRQELHLARTKLLKSLNKRLGEDFIAEIVFK